MEGADVKKKQEEEEAAKAKTIVLALFIIITFQIKEIIFIHFPSFPMSWVLTQAWILKGTCLSEYLSLPSIFYFMFISTSFAQRFFPFQMLWYCTLKRLCLEATTRDGKNWFLLCQRDSCKALFSFHASNYFWASSFIFFCLITFLARAARYREISRG